MRYVLMRHENDDVTEWIYREIERLGEGTLNKEQVMERVASVLVDPIGSYVHDEVKEYVRQREERHRESAERAAREGTRIIEEPNKLLVVSKRVRELAGDQPLTVAYNDIFRTEITARSVARVVGGNLVAGRLYEAVEVYDWMREHQKDNGLAVIVTHQPAVQRILGYVKARHSDAYLVSEENSRYKVVEELGG